MRATARAKASGEPPALVLNILSVKLPAKVYAAGPVSLEVQPESTASVQIAVDGVDLGELGREPGHRGPCSACLAPSPLPLRGARCRGTPQGEVKPTKTKQGLRWFPNEKIAVWNVGVRLGATLHASETLYSSAVDGESFLLSALNG
ncbi:MAG: hypothetical protein H0T76_16005 [Nannocystis sp.]|nr:hypothetical protein [Nannocystis sp.]MBA3547987.1 hypothetical protein [Nannocystis sp.]